MTAKKGTPRRPAAKKAPGKPGARRPPRKPKLGPVATALERDLAAIAKVDKPLADSALAACARSFASELDASGTSATLKVTCARALVDTLAQLRELLPKSDEKDALDELSARRTARLDRRAKA